MRSSEGDERLNNSHKKKTIISKDTISTSDEDDPFSQSTSSSPTKPTSVNKKAKYEPKKGINKSDDGRGEQEEKDDEDGHVIPISSKRRVTVRQWKSNVLVDIREFWGEEGDLKPGKKGISLTLDQWKMLKEKMEDIDEAIGKLSKKSK